MNTEIYTIVRRVSSAINNEGSHPHYHRQKLLQLKREWPTLYYAVADLARKVK